jgi:hypothetical protein
MGYPARGEISVGLRVRRVIGFSVEVGYKGIYLKHQRKEQ